MGDLEGEELVAVADPLEELAELHEVEVVEATPGSPLLEGGGAVLELTDLADEEEREMRAGVGVGVAVIVDAEGALPADGAVRPRGLAAELLLDRGELGFDAGFTVRSSCWKRVLRWAGETRSLMKIGPRAGRMASLPSLRCALSSLAAPAVKDGSG